VTATPSRKLAVILHADVVGSTALVQLNETLAHERIQDTFRRFSETIKAYGGITLELRGDALLAEFERASDAVSASIAFQASNTIQNEQLADDLIPVLRIGIAMGEVVIADNTVTGEGVVLAQRIEQLAEEGGICIQGAAHETIPNRFPFEYESLGEQSLKGFEDRVRVHAVKPKTGENPVEPESPVEPVEQVVKKTKPWQIRGLIVLLLLIGMGLAWWQPWKPVFEPASIERMALELPDKPSIAVLPFENMSNDADQEYFADGITEDLITDLSKLPELFVISRNSTFTYKGRAVKVGLVAEELGVRYVLEGSVRRVGTQVRINAQLIDALSGGHVWAERYDGSLTDIFALQDKVTGKIVTALALNLTGERSSRQQTSSAQAYDLFLRGWALYQRHNADDFAQAIPHFEAAIRLDAEYAQAHAALAAIYWEIWGNRWAKILNISLPDAMKLAKVHLEEAMKEPSSLAHWVASNLLIAEGNYETAIAEAKQIVALDANSADGYSMLANAMTLSGKPDESVKLIEKAARLDPNHSLLHRAAQKGDVDAVKRLIAERVNFDTKDYYGRTTLHVAAENGQAEIVALLIEAGADIEAGAPGYPDRRFFDATPLMVAAQRGRTAVAELLITAGADVNAQMISILGNIRTILYFATLSGHLDVAELLIANGANVNATTSLRLYTPLFAAARQGHSAIAELLIGKGAIVNAMDFNANTPLHLAVLSGELEIVQLLLANGADVDAKTVRGDYPGEAPLHVTAYSGNTQIVELLLTNGADIDAVTELGYTPLRRAVDQGHLAMAELLIAKGADITTRDTNGITPLHVIAQTDNISIAELLISGGAEINAKNKNSGFTPLDYAQDGDEKMIEMLKRHGALCTIC
jgi:adenylate cyclase